MKRIKDIPSMAGTTFEGQHGIRSVGIGQGEIGDCWLIASISAVAEYPERIKRIIKQVDAEKGIYEVSLWVKGKWVPIVIDDKLAVTANGYRPKFVRPGPTSGKSFWAALLEKAYAKLHVNYKEQLVGGWNTEAIYTLTGMPYTTH
jgi:hypothetical protein